MAYTRANCDLSDAAAIQQLQQRRLVYQRQLQMQQAPPYAARDARAHSQNASQWASAGISQVPMRQSTDFAGTAVPENDAVLPLPSGYGRQQHHQRHPYASHAPCPTSRSMTAPPAAGSVPPAVMSTSPLTRSGLPKMRPHHNPPPGTSGSQRDIYHCTRDRCMERFPNKPDLDAHEKQHKYSEKPLACPYPDCTWRFDYATDVKYHQKDHVNDSRAYLCDYPRCGKQYQRKHDLFCHVRDNHPGHPVPGNA